MDNVQTMINVQCYLAKVDGNIWSQYVFRWGNFLKLHENG